MCNQHDRALGHVIDSLGHEDFYSALAQYLSTYIAYDNFVVLAYSSDHAPKLLYSEIANETVTKSLNGAYLNGAYLLDPFFQAYRRSVQPGIYHLLEIAPDQFFRTSYYKTHYRNTAMVDELAAIAYATGGVAITACVGKDTRSNVRFTALGIKNLKRNQSTIIALIDRHCAISGPPDVLSDAHKHLSISTFILNVARVCNIQLTPRQAEVALQILQGHSSESIGLNLKISTQTVKVFRKQIYRRCRVSSQAELFSLLMPILIHPEIQ